MVELADSLDSGSSVRKDVRVRVPLRAPNTNPVEKAEIAFETGFCYNKGMNIIILGGEKYEEDKKS